MSRVGKSPIDLPQSVKVNLENNQITVTGPNGTLTNSIPGSISLNIEDSQILVARPSNSSHHRALHGMVRSIIANMVAGVTEGFSKQLILVGIGRDLAQLQENNLVLDVGFSHKVTFPIPEGISIEVQQGEIIEKLTHIPIIVKGIDKQLVGEIAATIRRIRPPEVYKPGKGIRYADERLRMKVGKTGTAGAV